MYDSFSAQLRPLRNLTAKRWALVDIGAAMEKPSKSLKPADITSHDLSMSSKTASF
jgi:hypothetical protein